MEQERNIVYTIKIGSDLQETLNAVEKRIENGTMRFESVDSFIETAIHVFIRILVNRITPYQFDTFVEECKKIASKNIDA